MFLIPRPEGGLLLYPDRPPAWTRARRGPRAGLVCGSHQWQRIHGYSWVCRTSLPLPQHLGILGQAGESHSGTGLKTRIDSTGLGDRHTAQTDLACWLPVPQKRNKGAPVSCLMSTKAPCDDPLSVSLGQPGHSWTFPGHSSSQTPILTQLSAHS